MEEHQNIYRNYNFNEFDLLFIERRARNLY